MGLAGEGGRNVQGSFDPSFGVPFIDPSRRIFGTGSSQVLRGASVAGLGAVLSQMSGRDERVVAYMGKTLSETEAR